MQMSPVKCQAMWAKKLLNSINCHISVARENVCVSRFLNHQIDYTGIELKRLMFNNVYLSVDVL